MHDVGIYRNGGKGCEEGRRIRQRKRIKVL